MSFLARLIVTVLGGALYSLPFVEPSLAPLAFVGLAPALFVLCPPRESPGPRATMLWALTAAFTLCALTGLPLQRISIVAIIVQSWLALPWPLVALLLFAWLRRRTGWPMALLWPCCWMITEWGKSFHSIGTAFGLSGYTMFVYPRLIQFADLGGVLGVSFLVQSGVGACADAAFAVGARGWPAWRSRAAWAPMAAVAAAVLLALAYGSVRLAGARVEAGPRLAMVQPALPHEYTSAQNRFVHITQLGMARRAVRPGDVDLVVFPENAVLDAIEGTEYLTQFQDLSRKLQTPLLAGVTTRPDADLLRLARGEPVEQIVVGSRSFGRAINTGAIITSEGIVAKYAKMHLMPFSELVPAEALFESLGWIQGYRRFVVGVLGYMGTGVPGPEVKLLSIPGSKAPPFWSPICFEQADARLAREAVHKGARYFINITSEGDLGPQIYWNTVGVSVLRAVELRVGIARCGNMGITGIIDPWGRQPHHLRGKSGALWGEPGVLKESVPLGPGGLTLYARLGDWPFGASLLALLVACAVALRRPRPPVAA